MPPFSRGTAVPSGNHALLQTNNGLTMSTTKPQNGPSAIVTMYIAMPIMVAAKNAGEKGIFWWEMCAIIVVMIIPVIVMAILLTRFISRGVLMGAVKG